MPTVAVHTPGARVSLKSERLVITPPEHSGEEPSAVPLADIEQLCLSPRVGISTSALAELLRREISTSVIDWNGRFLGAFHPVSPPRGATRLLQYQTSLDPDRSLPLARRLILSKILNERRILQRLHQRHRRGEPPLALTRHKESAARAMACDSVESLRGIEGSASALFLAAWAAFLPDAFPFVGRSTRPPLDPVNAVLSYLSALVYSEILAAAHLAGLDPAFGVLHETTDDRHSLPLDLMEPFRPAVIHPLTLRLFSQSILRGRHFEDKNPGVWLATEGRQIVHRHYEKLLLREFLSEHLDHRTTLRTQLRKAPLLFKAALPNPDNLLPFQLNGTSRIDTIAGGGSLG